ncbi:MAG: SusD/RagB family nutrient-binding outer membrane lipoprotein, partial [Capnocytophaga granulosa]
MKRIIISLLSVGLLFSSCEKDFEEINKNPNQPEDYLTAALFGNASFGFMYNLRKNSNSASLMRTWMQYTSETTYTKESRYQYKEGAGNDLWKQIYKRAEVLNKIIKLNTDPETKGEAAIFGSNLGQICAARTMMAYYFSILTETFGDVPYYSYGGRENQKFQALQLDKYITPEYADEKDIYLDILKELGEVSNDLSTLNEDDEVFSQGDFNFGSIGKLKRFTNSLRLRIANHVKNVSDAELKAAAEAVVNHYVSSNENELLKEGENVTLLFEDNYD